MTSLGKFRVLRAVAAAAIVAAGLGATTMSAAPADAHVVLAVALPGPYFYGYPGVLIGGAFGPYSHAYHWHRHYAFHHPFAYRYEHWH